MQMTPDDYFDLFVQGNYDDYRFNIGSIRQAFNVSVAASHLADHYFKYNKKYNPSKVNSFKRIGDFVEYLSAETKDCFRDIRSISNAYKHLYTLDDPKASIHATVSSPGAIESITFLNKKSEIKEIKEMWTEDSGTTKVVFTRIDGQRIDFLSTLDTVIKFWVKLLYRVDTGQ